MRKLTICLALLMVGNVFAFDAAAKTVRYSVFNAAISDCIGTIDQLVDLDGPTLINQMKEIKGNIYKLRRDATQAGENLAIYPNQGKKIAKRFKSRHLKFNRKIKEYQNKCKAVEKMLKGGVLLTD